MSLVRYNGSLLLRFLFSVLLLLIALIKEETKESICPLVAGDAFPACHGLAVFLGLGAEESDLGV